jgi:Ca2+-transporting ATPase/Ca2+ transporting ATPase
MVPFLIASVSPVIADSSVSACTLVAAGNDYQKEKQFIELNKVADDKKKITVIRDGEEC